MNTPHKTCLNPTQGLIKGQRLLTLLKDSPDTAVVLALFDEYLATVPWAVYKVRRTFSPRSDGRFNYARAVDILDAGTRPAMHTQLRARAQDARFEVTIGDPRFADDQHPRVWLRRREQIAPAAKLVPAVDAEHFLTVAPCTAITKTGPAFPNAWAQAAQLHLAI